MNEVSLRSDKLRNNLDGTHVLTIQEATVILSR